MEGKRYILGDLFLACMCKRYLEVKGTKILILTGKELFSRIRRRIDDDDVPEIVGFLRRNPNVVAVNLAYNHITDRGIEYFLSFLEEFDSLLDLNLINNNITGKGITLLSGIKNLTLKSLRINGNKVGPEGLKNLALMISTNKYLTNLDIGETDMDIGALVYFTTVLRAGNTSLQAINLSRVLGPPAHALQTGHVADVIHQMLSVNHTLKEIYLQKIGFIDHDIELLVEGLKMNQSLLVLDLSCNSIGDHGCESLASYLGTKPSLRCLFISNCNIGDAGARILSMQFPFSKVSFLDISRNKITEEGLLDILNHFKKERPAQGLFLRGNKIGEKTCKVLYRMVLSGVLEDNSLDLNLYCERGKKYQYTCSDATDHLKPHYYCLCSTTERRLCRQCDVTIIRNKRPIDKL